MIQSKIFQEQVITMIKHCYDPEIPVNVWDLGLIYAIKIDDQSEVCIFMTLTSPNCPVIDILPRQIEDIVKSIPWVQEVFVEIVWEPAWNEGMMSEEAKLELGML